ncbi:MAG TPA: PIN domain-containing protein [Terriglobia bacterium]|nr:PIN domain-containing protein [Terriglobia bacterium]
MIFDTDIVVWMLRKLPGAMRFAAAVEPADRNISVISHLELLRGCRDLQELLDLQELIAGWFVEVLPVTRDISEAAQEIMAEFALSRRPGMGDVLIAATALGCGEPMATCNRKHFDFIPGLDLKVFRP